MAFPPDFSDREDFLHLADLTDPLRDEINGRVMAVFSELEICPSCSAYLLRHLADGVLDGWKNIHGHTGCSNTYRREH